MTDRQDLFVRIMVGLCLLMIVVTLAFIVWTLIAGSWGNALVGLLCLATFVLCLLNFGRDL